MILVLVLLLFAGAAKPALAGSTTNLADSIRFGATGLNPFPSPLILEGRDSRRQLLVTGPTAEGTEQDLTHDVRYEVTPPGVVRVDRGGMAIPLANGEARVTARSSRGGSVSLPVRVERFEAPRPVHFQHQVVPIFTKAGCNSGGCHGKAEGQNGFRLSLLGFEPAEDYEFLVKEARGRRLFPAAPERSLLLLKGTALIPHGGGKRLEVDSDEYRLLVRWIAQGMLYGAATDPVLDRIEVIPPQRTIGLGGAQQLAVLARYSDGAVVDVTRSTLYEANDREMAEVDSSGRVKLGGQPGTVAVMVRYQGKVATFRATLPLGAPVADLPPARGFIDEHVQAKLYALGLPPSPLSDDATFLRRATLDIAGRLPSPEEARRFSSDTAADKRDRWIDTLLASPDYADYFANKWSALLRNKRTDPRQARGAFAFHNWIRDSLDANKPYDQFVSELVTASGDLAENPPVAWFRQVRQAQQQLEDTAQLFLGTRLQCAQCHHHPYERWSQQDYFRFGAFFSQLSRKPGSQPGEDLIFAKRSMPRNTHPKTRLELPPSGLGSDPVAIPEDEDARTALADWMTNPNNPFFAKSLVNRYWKHFLGRGLVEPEDDLRDTNPPTNPELLEALARSFIQSGFDLKALIRNIARSSTYQLSATPNQHNKPDKQHYSRFYPRRLTAEVLLDSVHEITGSQTRFDGVPPGTRAVQLPDNSFNANSYFLTVFGRPDSSSACECERSQDASLAQSLHLLNAKDLQTQLAADTGRPARLAADTSRPEADHLADLYLQAVSRPPTAEELQLASEHIRRSVGSPADPKETVAARRRAYEDIVWALINSKEFLFNH